jgi:hypothetical protein
MLLCLGDVKFADRVRRSRTIQLKELIIGVGRLGGGISSSEAEGDAAGCGGGDTAGWILLDGGGTIEAAIEEREFGRHGMVKARHVAHDTTAHKLCPS